MISEIALTLNSGSSSVRMDGFQISPEIRRVAQVKLPDQQTLDPATLKSFLNENSLSLPKFVAHRVVHGGREFSDSCKVTSQVEQGIDQMARLAPLHNPFALKMIRSARTAFGPYVPQVAVFDTSFFHHLPAHAARYAIPRDLAHTHGIRKYGFHGLAHQSMLGFLSQHTDQTPPRRVISIQLGSGCSMAAIKDGSPIDTTMGFSPLEGLVMATRCGDIDPGVLLYLLRVAGLTVAELEELLNSQSGLLGLSGESSDLSKLFVSVQPSAQEAIAVFCHSIQRHLGAMMASLRGVDAIVFGGGIGQHSADLRMLVLKNFLWAGMDCDAHRNAAVSPHTGGPIHSDTSRTQIWVAPVDEARVLIQEGLAVLENWRPMNDSE